MPYYHGGEIEYYDDPGGGTICVAPPTIPAASWPKRADLRGEITRQFAPYLDRAVQQSDLSQQFGPRWPLAAFGYQEGKDLLPPREFLSIRVIGASISIATGNSLRSSNELRSPDLFSYNISHGEPGGGGAFSEVDVYRKMLAQLVYTKQTQTNIPFRLHRCRATTIRVRFALDLDRFALVIPRGRRDPEGVSSEFISDVPYVDPPEPEGIPICVSPCCMQPDKARKDFGVILDEGDCTITVIGRNFQHVKAIIDSRLSKWSIVERPIDNQSRLCSGVAIRLSP